MNQKAYGLRIPARFFSSLHKEVVIQITGRTVTPDAIHMNEYASIPDDFPLTSIPRYSLGFVGSNAEIEPNGTPIQVKERKYSKYYFLTIFIRRE
ncbi:hypothetical protein Q5O89_09475 [Peribacillus frigoritolerans]|nr:hypothetical protein [Peribacillus frigoritolerans]